MHEKDGFSWKTHGKSRFHFRTDWSGNGPAASSDKWKALLDNNVAREKERWQKKLPFGLLLRCACFSRLATLLPDFRSKRCRELSRFTTKQSYTAVITNSKEYENIVPGSVIFILAKYLQKYSWTYAERRLALFCCGHVNYKMCIFGSNKWVCVQRYCSTLLWLQRSPPPLLNPHRVWEGDKLTRAHQPTAWLVPNACAQPYEPAVAAMDSFFSSAWHNRWTSVTTAMPCPWPLKRAYCSGYPGDVAVRIG